MAFGKLLTHVCVCHQACSIIWYRPRGSDALWKVTPRLVKRNGSLPSGFWLSHLWVDCQETGVSPSPTLRSLIEYGTTLLFMSENTEFTHSACNYWTVCYMEVTTFCTEEYVSPDTKLADCLYQCEKFSRSNHSTSKELKLLFKVLYWFHLYYSHIGQVCIEYYRWIYKIIKLKLVNKRE